MKQVGRVKFEVFVDSVNGSDVITFDYLADAKAYANKWAKELKLKKHESVVVLKVEETIMTEIKGEE